MRKDLLHVEIWNDESILAVPDQFRRRAVVEGDHRTPRRHGLRERAAK